MRVFKTKWFTKAAKSHAIILAKGGQHWFYTFLYAKQDMANIDNRELAGFR